eukprot:3354232-Karenia_brevis.AAC.1
MTTCSEYQWDAIYGSLFADVQKSNLHMGVPASVLAQQCDAAWTIQLWWRNKIIIRKKLHDISKPIELPKQMTRICHSKDDATFWEQAGDTGSPATKTEDSSA